MLSLTIDIFELARKCETLEGEMPLEDMPELAKVVSALDKGGVIFTVEGLGTLREYPAVRLSIAGTATMTCARCNKPVSVPFTNELTFILTESEEEADKIPLDEDDERQDVTVGSRQFKLNEWIQEETLLTLPLAATHESCEAEYNNPKDEDVPHNNPFAALAGLKKLN